MLEHLSISSSHGSRVQNKKQLTVVRPNASRKHKKNSGIRLVGVFNSWWVSTKQVHILLFFTVAVGHAYLSAPILVVKLVASCLTVAHHASYLFIYFLYCSESTLLSRPAREDYKEELALKAAATDDEVWWQSFTYTDVWRYAVFFPSILPPPPFVTLTCFQSPNIILKGSCIMI